MFTHGKCVGIIKKNINKNGKKKIVQFLKRKLTTFYNIGYQKHKTLIQQAHK